jgi:hypothetical protein
MSGLKPDLIAAYSRAIYRVSKGGSAIDFTVDEHSEGIGSILLSHSFEPAALITAFNPRSESRLLTDNEYDPWMGAGSTTVDVGYLVSRGALPERLAHIDLLKSLQDAHDLPRHSNFKEAFHLDMIAIARRYGLSDEVTR